MFSRSSQSIIRSAKVLRRFNSSSSHGSTEPPKNIEISVTKIFGVAALAGGLLVYKNHENRDKPLYKTKLYNEEEERPTARSENYLKRYKTSFLSAYMKDRGGIGQRQYRRISESIVPTTVIPSHSPEGDQFGAGIKTDQLGPRRERIRLYAPLLKSE
ncbi:uncharacterized protein PRCAT00000694001 [Priceomyces carsonii]|uniref:uncharacterized protein n=1 Tax=Priceomyces carsonii TaxID=28549 RepID=UPI002EDB7C5A|nr:unnamed protein product [Priceomyces carsonii]